MKHFDKKQHYLGRILAADPGQMRFKNAIKATASLGFSAFTTFLLLYIIDEVQLTAVVMSGMIGMMSIIIAMDPTEAARKKTTLLLTIPGFLGMTAGVLFGDQTIITDALMVLVITGGFYFSRYGSRYFSLGQMSFMSIYAAYITQLSWAELPWMLVGVIMGIINAYVFNFFLFQNAAKTLKHSMRAFHIQANVTINLLIDSIQSSEANEQRNQQLEKNIDKLLVYADIVIGQLNEEEIQELWPGLEQTQVRLYVFNANLLIETLKDTLYKLKETNVLEDEELRQSLVALLSLLREANINAPAHYLAEAKTAAGTLHENVNRLSEQTIEKQEWLFLLRRVESIVNHVIESGEAIQYTLATGESSDVTYAREQEEIAEEEESNAPATQPLKEAVKLSPPARKAIQVFIASVIAIIVGETVTPIQPYWVLLTVFICMLGTESVGRVYKKGLQRSVGTVIGAVIGFSLAIALHGHIPLEIISIFIITFISGYIAPVSYTLMSVFITMTVAFMYNILLDGVSANIILARIIETVAGALIAYVVSIFIFPKKTNDKIIEVSQDYLNALKPYVISYVKNLRKGNPVHEPTGQALTLDNKLQMIEDEASPIMKRTEAHSHSNISEVINLFMAINYYTRHLLSSSQRYHLDLPETVEPILEQVELKMAQNIDTLSALLTGQAPDATAHTLDEEHKQIEHIIPKSSLANSNLIDNIYDIRQINRCLFNLIEGFRHPRRN